MNIHISLTQAIDSAASGVSLAAVIHILPILAHQAVNHLGWVAVSPMIASAVLGLGLPLIGAIKGSELQ